MRKKALQILVVLLAFSPLAIAQTGSGKTAGTAQNDGEGKEVGGYQVEQSIELGYRFTDVKGSQQIFDTFINQNEGPRLLEQTLSMRSLNNSGILFDRLSASSFGWGGDPENVARLQMSKNLWYDFSFSFRRDQNFFDYDLMVNPLNPPTSTPNIPVTFSAHKMQITRRMYDAGLTLMPQSKFTIRLGFRGTARKARLSPASTREQILAQPGMERHGQRFFHRLRHKGTATDQYQLRSVYSVRQERYRLQLGAVLSVFTVERHPRGFRSPDQYVGWTAVRKAGAPERIGESRM